MLYTKMLLCLAIAITFFINVNAEDSLYLLWRLSENSDQTHEMATLTPITNSPDSTELSQTNLEDFNEISEIDINDYIYMDQDDTGKIKFDNENNKPLPFEYKPLDYENYEMDEYGNLDLTKLNEIA